MAVVVPRTGRLPVFADEFADSFQPAECDAEADAGGGVGTRAEYGMPLLGDVRGNRSGNWVRRRYEAIPYSTNGSPASTHRFNGLSNSSVTPSCTSAGVGRLHEW